MKEATIKLDDKLTITVEDKIDISFTVSLPHFRKRGDIFYKVISDSKAIKVDFNELYPEIEAGRHHVSMAFHRSDEILESEFNLAFESALKMISEYGD